MAEVWLMATPQMKFDPNTAGLASTIIPSPMGSLSMSGVPMYWLLLWKKYNNENNYNDNNNCYTVSTWVCTICDFMVRYMCF